VLSKKIFSVGDIVSYVYDHPERRKNSSYVGFITKVYKSPVKLTYQVSWFNWPNANDLAIEGYYLEKV